MPDIFDMQLDAYPSMSEVNRLLSEDKPCEHKITEKAQHYYGVNFDTDFYWYWICSDCGVEIESEPDET